MDPTRVIILGLGRAGCRIAAKARADHRFAGLEVVIADTDALELREHEADRSILLGHEWAHGEGTGSNDTLGERATTASGDELTEVLRGARLVVTVAGMGCGTGSGGARVVAKIAGGINVPAFFLVTLPFAFEGPHQCHEAERLLRLLRDLSDAVVAVPNDLLFTCLPADTGFDEAFALADSTLARGAAGIARIAAANAKIPVDMARVKGILKGARELACTVGVGRAAGPDAAAEAIRSFRESPFVGGAEGLARTESAMLTLLGGSGLSAAGLRACLEEFQACFPKDARLAVGAYIDPELGNEVQLTALLCTRPAAPRQGRGDTPADTGTKPPRPRGKRRRDPEEEGKQGLLPLQIQSTGVFSGTQATTLNGENLDIPTFQREGIPIDTR